MTSRTFIARDDSTNNIPTQCAPDLVGERLFVRLEVARRVRCDSLAYHGRVKTTRYFEEDILGSKRPGIKREWCERVLRNPEFTEV